MAQTIFSNINPSTTSGNQLATILNDFKDAVASGFSGIARPANLQDGGYWIDTAQAATPNFLWKMKVWTGSVDIEVFRLNISTNTVSIAGTTGSFSLSQVSADSVGPILKFLKQRIANNGQSLIGDSLGDVNFTATTNTGSEVISMRMRVVATNNATTSVAGAYLSFEEIDTGTGSLLEKMRLVDGRLALGVTAPTHTLHIKSLIGIKIEQEEDSTTGSVFIAKKKRVATNGQVLSGDTISSYQAISQDQLGADVPVFTIVSEAAENHTSTAHGTKVTIKRKKKTTTTMEDIVIIDDLFETPLGSKTKYQIVGTSGTAATNTKLHRSATSKLSVVKGDDATAEGSDPTVLGKLGFVFESYVNASKPANSANNAGRVIYVSDTNKYEYDTGAAWSGLGGGALVVSSQISLTSAAAIVFSGTTSRRLFKVQSSTGEQDLSALNPQIQAGIDEGQELILIGQSDTDYIILKNGNGLKLNGDWISTNQSMLSLVWVGSTWIEMARS